MNWLSFGTKKRTLQRSHLVLVLSPDIQKCNRPVALLALSISAYYIGETHKHTELVPNVPKEVCV